VTTPLTLMAGAGPGSGAALARRAEVASVGGTAYRSFSPSGNGLTLEAASRSNAERWQA
jgi:hypothetical protein